VDISLQLSVSPEKTISSRKTILRVVLARERLVVQCIGTRMILIVDMEVQVLKNLNVNDMMNGMRLVLVSWINAVGLI
jgi:hypothetical protein